MIIVVLFLDVTFCTTQVLLNITVSIIAKAELITTLHSKLA